MFKPLLKKQVFSPVSIINRSFLHCSSISSSKNSQRPVYNASNHPILRRVPNFLLPYTKSFINAPLSHVTSFLILHELTAIVPLLGIWYMLHKYQWLVPLDLPTWAIEKGTKIIDKSMTTFDFSEYSISDKAKMIMEGAYAYAIVKSLFPVRILISLGLMPYFAKYIFTPFTSAFKRKGAQSTPSDIKPNEETIKLKEIRKPRL